MVSALDSGSNGPGSSPGRGTVLCSSARHFTPIVPLSTQVHKWVPANLLLGVSLRWTSISSTGGVGILLVASCYGNRDKLRPDGPLGSIADFLKLTFTLGQSRKYTLPCCTQFRVFYWQLQLNDFLQLNYFLKRFFQNDFLKRF